MLKIAVLIIVFTLASNLQAQLFTRSVNRYNDTGKRQGLWIAYWDEENKIPMSKVRYDNGREKCVSKEYHQNGNLRLKMRYYRNNRVRVKYFDEGRKLEQKGWAVMEYNENNIHYYWHGKWKFYNNEHKILESAIYEYGKELKRVVHHK